MDEQYQHYIAMQQSPMSSPLKTTQSMGEIDSIYGLRKPSMFQSAQQRRSKYLERQKEIEEQEAQEEEMER